MNRNVPARAEREKNVMVYRKGESLLNRAGGPRLRYRGIALIWSAILMLVMIGLVGLSIDWGKLAVNVHQMQNAADAAALAGAQIVKIDSAEARQQAHDIGFLNAAEGLAVTLRPDVQDEPFPNPTDWSDPTQVKVYEDAMAPFDIILGRWINHLGHFFVTLDTPDAVMAIARRNTTLGADAPALAMIFGPVFDVNTINAQREAIGWANGIGGAGLIVLNPDARPGLYIAGTGDIRVVGGTIHVNSTGEGTKSSAAVYVQGNGQMLCGRLTLQGHTDPASGSSEWNAIWRDDAGIQWPYDIGEGAPYVADPLGYVPAPTISADDLANPKTYVTNTSCTLEPGYYPDGIEVSSTGITVTLNPGTYFIGGGNLPGGQLAGLVQTGGALIGHGVLIYLTKDYTSGNWAKLDIGGNVVTDITPPGDEVSPKVIDGLDGISIWQDRANTANTARVGGGGGMNISGTLYFPNNHVYLAGTPGKAGNQILCGSMEVFGTAEVQVIYDGRNNMSKRRAILVR